MHFAVGRVVISCKCPWVDAFSVQNVNKLAVNAFIYMIIKKTIKSLRLKLLA